MSENSQEAHCHLYDIIDPDPSILTESVWGNIQNNMDSPGWFGEIGNRIGFISTMRFENIISGFFANEGKKRVFQYDDHKLLIGDPVYLFEHLFFAIFIDTSQLLIQHRNIYGYLNLSINTMRVNLLKTIGTFLKLNNIHLSSDSVQISFSGEQLTQEELYNFFVSNNVFKLEVKDLDANLIPLKGDPKYPLYNPKVEMTEITWGAIADTLEYGTNAITIEGDQFNPNVKINKGPIPKAFAAIGNIEQVDAFDSQGMIHIRRRTQNEEILIELPSDPIISQKIIESILSKTETNDRIIDWQNRKRKREQNLYKGTLFNSPD
jgi:hypothetical protein